MPRLRTVGDPAQHASVEAGGGWATIVDRHPETTPKLTENRRMAGDAMADVRLAAEDYRDHKISQALRRLEHDDRIVTAATSTELLDDLAVDWFVDWRRHLAAPDQVEPSRMLAENHTVRRDLNARAQVLLKEEGLIGVEGVKIGESTFHVGDQVVARQQDRDLRPTGGDRNSFVRNGTRGVVTAIEDAAGPAPRLVVDFDRRGPVTVPNEFLTKRLRPGVVGGLAPAYAMTTHAAQGDTYDTSRAVVTDRSSPEGTYVALTRGRHDLRLYTVAAQEFAAPNPAAEHGLPVSNDRRTLEDRIEARLSRPSPTQLATVADPDLTKLRQYRDIPVRRLEELDDPIAQRVARIKLGQAQRNTVRDLPADLVAVVGDERDSRAWRSAVARFAHYRERWQSDPLRSMPSKGAPAVRLRTTSESPAPWLTPGPSSSTGSPPDRSSTLADASAPSRVARHGISARSTSSKRGSWPDADSKPGPWPTPTVSIGPPAAGSVAASTPTPLNANGGSSNRPATISGEPTPPCATCAPSPAGAGHPKPLTGSTSNAKPSARSCANKPETPQRNPSPTSSTWSAPDHPRVTSTSGSPQPGQLRATGSGASASPPATGPPPPRRHRWWQRSGPDRPGPTPGTGTGSRPRLRASAGRPAGSCPGRPWGGADGEPVTPASGHLHHRRSPRRPGRP